MSDAYERNTDDEPCPSNDPHGIWLAERQPDAGHVHDEKPHHAGGSTQDHRARRPEDLRVHAGGARRPPARAMQILRHSKSVITMEIYTNPRELHHMGEKPQVSWSVQAPNEFRSPMAGAR
jgi:hypothetical protein